MPGECLLGGCLEEELAHIAGLETGGEVIERAVTLAAGATTVGFAAGGEALDEGGAQEVAGDLQGSKQPVPPLAKRQSRFAVEDEYLSHLLGQDDRREREKQEKESASPKRISSTHWSPATYLIRLPPPSGTAASAVGWSIGGTAPSGWDVAG